MIVVVAVDDDVLVMEVVVEAGAVVWVEAAVVAAVVVAVDAVRSSCPTKKNIERWVDTKRAPLIAPLLQPARFDSCPVHRC